MRIHANTLTPADLHAAARTARVDLDYTSHGSRVRGHAFAVHLQGESRRRPNGGAYGAGSGYAATWDQWGVFLAELFTADESVSIPRVYADADAFDRATDCRFVDGWPADAHGDHTFRSARPYVQACTKCSAVTVWSPALQSAGVR